MARAFKYFCKRGHDRSTSGALKNGYCKKCASLTAKARYQANSEAIKEKVRLWTRLHKEENSTRAKKWRRSNPDRHGYNILRKADKKAGREYLSLEAYLRIRQDRYCYYCGKEVFIEGFIGSGIDRIDSTQGHTVGNVRVCCSMCNRMKSNYSEHDFYSQIQLILSRRRLYERS